ncbi:uncharacterized protein [Anoplolepis gracilipes]|uniref:uncharacterized protein n=1 Tax=Anoplolepis gracilipes TaxID=354296 RepID=UPI003B9E826C
MTEGKEMMVQRGLSEWWNEETEYMLQRIERWATFVRGYNRLRSQRWWSKETLQDIPDASDEAASRFYSLKRSRWKSRPEEIKINCCGRFNYQSNSKLESNCLETYRYDHSIYFKTIGDIRNDKRDIIKDLDRDTVSISSEELVEWDARSLVADLIANKPISEETCNNNRPDEPGVSDTFVEQEKNGAMQNAWPIVDLSKLDLNLMDNQKRGKQLSCLLDRENYERNEKQQKNNNVNIPEDKTNKEDNESKNYKRMKKFPSFRKIKRSPTRISPIVGENNVIWPGVLLNYNNNFDVAGISLQD